MFGKCTEASFLQRPSVKMPLAEYSSSKIDMKTICNVGEREEEKSKGNRLSVKLGMLEKCTEAQYQNAPSRIW